MNFCRRCGAKLTLSGGHVFTCPNRHTIYANSSPATAVILTNEINQVLVLRRAVNPGKGALDFPGGFCDGAETPEACTYRELEEETGIAASQISPLTYVASGIDNYDYSGEKVPVLSLFYAATCNSNVPLRAGDDAESIKFVPIEDLSPEDFHFESAQAIVPLIQSQLKSSKGN